MQGYDDLPTEAVNPDSRALDTLEVPDLLRVLLEEERRVPAAIQGALPEIELAVLRAAKALRRGGRIVYAGAGTSGRIGVMDAAECPPTFGTDPGRVVGLVAGGRDSVFSAREGAEDDFDGGAASLRNLHPGPADFVVGIAASGVTRWVRGALVAATEAGSGTALVTAGISEGASAGIVIRLDTGPEVIAGSTRLKAGTATKIVRNMISTGAMVRTGRVYGNLMVDLRAGSVKLRARAERLVRSLTGGSGEEARELLDRAGGEVKTAVVMARQGVGADEARARLAAAGGFLRTVLGEEAP